MFRSAAVIVAVIAISAFSLAACQPANPADLYLTAGVEENGNELPPPVSVVAGKTINIFVTVSVSTGYTNYPISVTDHLPGGLIFLSSGDNGGECTADRQDITCLSGIGSTTVNRDATFFWSLQVDPRASGTITNTVKGVYAGDTNLQNNNVTVTLAVTAPPLATQELDFQKAKNAGAQFPVDVRRNEDCRRLGVGDWLDADWDYGSAWSGPSSIWPNGRHSGVVFMVDCIKKQGEAFVDAFDSFKLKNGWQVKSISQENYAQGDVAFSLDASPQPGNCRPTLKAHLRSYGISLRNFSGDPQSMNAVLITIEGPADTDPYSGSPSVFCEP